MLTWHELAQLGRQETLCDIHCVTRWSRYDNLFEGVPVRTILRHRPAPRRTLAHVLVHAEPGLHHQPSAGGPRPRRPTCSRLTHDGEPLTPEHGGPGAPAGAAPLPLEERQVGHGVRVPRRRTSPASGSRTATTCAAIRGGRSGTGGRIRRGCAGDRGASHHWSGRHVKRGRQFRRPRLPSGRTCYFSPPDDDLVRSSLAGAGGRAAGRRHPPGRRRAGRAKRPRRWSPPSGRCASGWPRWWPTSATTSRPCRSRRRAERQAVLNLVAEPAPAPRRSRRGSRRNLKALEELELRSTGSWAIVADGPDRVGHHRDPVPGRLRARASGGRSAPIPTGPTTWWPASSPRCAR